MEDVHLTSRSSRDEPLDLEIGKAGLEEIGARLKRGELSEAEADAERLVLLSQMRPPRSGWLRNLRVSRQMLVVAAVGIVPIAAIGAVMSYVGVPASATISEKALAPSDPNGEVLAGLEDYARSIGTEHPPSGTGAGQGGDDQLLPDVNTMIERLAARLETTPQDVEGWRTLGWSYFHTGRYDQAVSAFEKALSFNPGSAELKASYEEAKTKMSAGGVSAPTSPGQSASIEKGSDELNGETAASIAALPPLERDSAIRSMVDGLAQRLESSPRDAEGWIRLMRSRVVLGEKDSAAIAFRKALEVFTDDSAAAVKIKSAGTELGLKAE